MLDGTGSIQESKRERRDKGERLKGQGRGEEKDAQPPAQPGFVPGAGSPRPRRSSRDTRDLVGLRLLFGGVRVWDSPPGSPSSAPVPCPPRGRAPRPGAVRPVGVRAGERVPPSRLPGSRLRSCRGRDASSPCPLGSQMHLYAFARAAEIRGKAGAQRRRVRSCP